MKKRLLAILLAAVMVCALQPVTALALGSKPVASGVDGPTVGGVDVDEGKVTTTVDKDGATHEFTTDANGVLTKYTGPGGDVVIPDGVTEIGNLAFYGRTNLTSIVIPETVTSIPDSAFYACSELTRVTIPSSMTSIGNYAFYHCTNLIDVTIPDGLTSIGNYAFGYCTNLPSVTIPTSVASLGWDAFCDCENITVYGYKDSVAQSYCEENSIPFDSLGVAPGTAQEGTLESVDGRSLSWTMTTEGALTITGQLAAGEMVIVGCYNRAGRMTGAKVLSDDCKTAQIDPNTPNVRLFWLGANHDPLSPSVTVWGK